MDQMFGIRAYGKLRQFNIFISRKVCTQSLIKQTAVVTFPYFAKISPFQYSETQWLHTHGATAYLEGARVDFREIARGKRIVHQRFPHEGRQVDGQFHAGAYATAEEKADELEHLEVDYSEATRNMHSILQQT